MDDAATFIIIHRPLQPKSQESPMEEQSTLSPAALATRVLTDPKTAFEAIVKRPNWLFPILLSLIVSFSFMYYTQDIQIEYQKKSILESEKIPEEQKDKVLENLENPSFFMKTVMPAIGVVISVFAIPALLAAVLMLFGNFVFGGNATFGTLFSVSAWAGMVGIVEALIKLPLIVINRSFDIYTSLALLLDPADSKTVVFQLANMVDIFTVWKIFVFGTAFAVVYKLSPGKSYGTITALYVVFALIGIGISHMF